MPSTIYSLPPPILQNFNRLLLSAPTPKFCDDGATLWTIYQYIKRRLQRKIRDCDAGKDRLFLQFEREFLELHARITKKEAEHQEKTGAPFHGPYDYFNDVGRHSKGLFSKVKWRAIYKKHSL